ncbi:MAG: NADH:ubiquinone reductase (Na(+)-transporting) subunit C [Candidatus Neomarinimicrobiota bacterium]|nr:NADH:ubiquinone reductase (Na(+)-transporting) subunit C [Candidatus Neomarinimicrobiota bacterium]
MHSNRYTLLFVFIITVVLGTLLSVTKENLKLKQEDNLRADVNKTILRSLDFSEEEDNPWSNEKVEEIFNNSIVGLCVDSEGNKIDNVVLEEIDIEKDIERLPVYLKVIDDELQGVALPVAGKGLWSTLFGYIALAPDLDTVLGIQFYKHGETPGLGGEVEKEWFTNNFVGKKIRNVEGEIIGIKVLKGKVDDSKEDAIHQVDGISGATVTSNGVTIFLKDDLKRYEAYLNEIRENGII